VSSTIVAGLMFGSILLFVIYGLNKYYIKCLEKKISRVECDKQDASESCEQLERARARNSFMLTATLVYIITTVVCLVVVVSFG